MVIKLPGGRKLLYLLLVVGLGIMVIGIINPRLGSSFGRLPHQPRQGEQHLLAEGRQIFRYDTFGSEAFWGGQLRLHEAIKGAQLGGVGPQGCFVFRSESGRRGLAPVFGQATEKG